MFFASSAFSLSLTVNDQAGIDTYECLQAVYINKPCKTIGYIARNLEVKENVCIVLSSPVVSVVTVVLFDGWTNVTLQGNGATMNCLKERSGYSAGLYFINSQGVMLRNLTMVYCSIADSFSNINKDKYKFRSGLIIKNTSYVCISLVVVTNSDGYGAVLINNYDSIDITESKFIKSNLSESYVHDTIGGSGMMILVSEYDLYDTKNCIRSKPTNNTYYDFDTVVFDSNIIKKPMNLSNRDRALSYGGGLNILLSWQAFSQNFTIFNATFSRNSAEGGGGLALTLKEKANCNEILIQNCSFAYNTAGGGGGGVKVELHKSKNDVNETGTNDISFNKCSFINNSATYGGGVALKIASLMTNTNVAKLFFQNCKWKFNLGVVSAAVDISQLVQRHLASRFLSTPEFENCRFTMNRYKKTDLKTGGFATFLISRCQVLFSGTIAFSSNHLTGLFLASAKLSIRENSSMRFYDNNGYQAGGITAIGFSIIQYGDNVHFNFTHNTGTIVGSGGAIYASSYDPHVFDSSRFCFIQSSEGNASNVVFYFMENGPIATIFVTGLQPCRYVCAQNDAAKNLSTYNPFNNAINNCLGQFYFHNQTIGKLNVSTEAAYAQWMTDKLKVVSGVLMQIPVIFKDDLNQNVTESTIYYPKTNKMGINMSSVIVGNNHLAINGRPGFNGYLELRVQGQRNYKTGIRYEIHSCPPGYVTDVISQKCRCSVELSSDYWYNGIVGCNETEMSIFILPDYWLGYIGGNNSMSDKENQLYSGQCPPGYCSMIFITKGFLNGHFYQMKSEPTLTNLSHVMCSKEREGILCGQCKKGTSTYLHSDRFVCQTESKSCSFGLLLYVLSELVPLTILFIVVICLNVTFTSGAAYSIVFFTQQLHIMEMSIHGIIQFQNNILVQVANFFYSILNLQFFNAEIFSFCLWKGATTMDALVMRLVSVAYALLLLLLLVFIINKCSRCTRYCKRNSSIVHGLTAFIVICYSEATHVSFNFLNYETLKGKGGIKYPHKVVFNNGEMIYFSKSHLVYAIPALIVVALIIIPTPICLLCDPILLKIEDKIKLFENYRPWTRLREKFKPLLDSFQGCFKDKFRIFAGLFFLYRTAILANLFIFSDNMQYHFVIEIILVIIFCVQAVAQPFEVEMDNIMASLLFFALLTINTLSIRINAITGNKLYAREVKILQYCQLLLVYLPLFMLLIWIIKAMHSKCIQWKKMHRNATDESEVEVSLIYSRNQSAADWNLK